MLQHGRGYWDWTVFQVPIISTNPHPSNIQATLFFKIYVLLLATIGRSIIPPWRMNQTPGKLVIIRTQAGISKIQRLSFCLPQILVGVGFVQSCWFLPHLSCYPSCAFQINFYLVLQTPISWVLTSPLVGLLFRLLCYLLVTFTGSNDVHSLPSQRRTFLIPIPSACPSGV